MAKLRVLKSGRILSELTLEPGKEFTIGRGSNCSVVLPYEAGISRQHLKVVEMNGSWSVQMLSKYGGLLYNGQSVETLELRGKVEFTIPPFNFVFDEADAENIVGNESLERSLSMSGPSVATNSNIILPTEEAATPGPNKSSKPDTSTIRLEDQNILQMEDGSDATQIMQKKALPYLVINNLKIRTEDVLKLDGNHWSCGRSNQNQIHINDSAISRKHFDIFMKDGSYFIMDHGSSNGTILNGTKIPPNIEQRISSGDVLKIRHIEIIFEIRDPNFSKMLEVLPASEDSQENGLSPGSDRNFKAPAVLRMPPEEDGAEPGSPNLIKKIFANKVRVAIAVIIILALFMGMSDDPPAPPTNNNGGTNLGSNKPGDKILSADEQAQLRDNFNLAKDHYNNQKYELCLAQIEKIHSVVPFYENSNELVTWCQQGKEMQEAKANQRALELKKLEAEAKINSVVAECRSIVKKETTTPEIEACLSPATEIDPLNEQITALKLEVASNENAIKAKEDKALDFARRKNEGRNMFERAGDKYKSGSLKEALAQYQKFLNGNYPGLNREQDEATRNISSIRSTLEERLTQALNECQSSMDQGNLKSAYLACDKVVRENPGNDRAKSLRDKSMTQMDTIMKVLYDDGVLEESLGSIESAKKKWQEIMDKAVPQNKYYPKAKSRLKKYGNN